MGRKGMENWKRASSRKFNGHRGEIRRFIVCTISSSANKRRKTREAPILESTVTIQWQADITPILIVTIVTAIYARYTRDIRAIYALSFG